MAKISLLPAVTLPLDPADTLVLVQDGVTKRGTVNELVGDTTRMRTMAELATDLAVRALDLPGFVIDFTRDFFVKTAPGNFAVMAAGLALACPGLAFARAGTQIEPAGFGAFSTFAAGAPAFECDATGAIMGLVSRPARTQMLEFSQKFNEGVYWTRIGVTVPVSTGVGPLGTDEWRIETDTSVGEHRFTQTENPVTIGQPYTMAIKFRPGQITQLVLAMGGAPFSTATGPLLLLDTVEKTATLTNGTATDYRIDDLGGGVFEAHVTKTATVLSPAGSLIIYAAKAGSINFAGVAGEGYSLISAEMYEGAKRVGPVITPGNVVVTTVKSTLALTVAGAQQTNEIDFDNSRSELIPGSTLMSLSTGAVAEDIRVVEAGGSYALQIWSGGVLRASVGGPFVRIGKERIAAVVDTAAKTAQLWVNGIFYGTATHANFPVGLVKLAIGTDAAGNNQCNVPVAVVRHGSGAGPAVALSRREGNPLIAAAAIDRSEIIVTGDGAGGFYVFHPLGSSNREDYVRTRYTNRLFVAQHTNGLASDRADHVARTGDKAFGSSIAKLIDTFPAQDDSWFVVGSPDTGNFWAIMDGVASPTTKHGYMEQQSALLLLDGRPYTPALGEFARGKRLRLYQDVKCLRPANPSEHLANRYQCAEFSAAGRRRRISLTAVAGFTLAAGSYPDMMSANVGRFNLATSLGATAAMVAGVTGFFDSPFPVMAIGDGSYQLSFEIVDGFNPGAAVRAQNGDTSAEDKLYFQPYAADRVMVAGDVLSFETFHSYSRVG